VTSKRRATTRLTGFLPTVLAVMGLAAASAALADTEHVEEVEGKKASLALLEREMQAPKGAFCGAKHSEIVVRVDERGEGTTSLENERDVAEDRVLRIARSLRRNRSVTVLYCEGTDDGSVATVTTVSRFAWGKKKGWTASVIKTGESIVADPAKPGEAEIVQTLADGSRAVNKTLPVMIDKDTRLDSTEASGKVFLYNFTFVEHEASAIDPLDFARSMKPQIARGACEDEASRAFLENGVRYRYRYHGKDGEEIATITVGSKDCR